MGKELGMALRKARIAKDKKVKDVAEIVGVTPSAVSQWEAGTSEPSFTKIKVVSDYLQVDLIRSVEEDLHNELIRRNELAHNLMSTDFEFAKDAPKFSGIVGLARDIPVLGNAVAGDDADFRLNGSETDRVLRPPGLADAKDIFALYTVNDSMYPAWKEGALFYVNPHRRPAIGDDVVVEVLALNPGDPGAAYLKRLKARRGDKVIVEQFNPPREIEFERDAIRLYRVIPWDEALGLA